MSESSKNAPRVLRKLGHRTTEPSLREIEVLNVLIAGEPRKGIAQRLAISYRTVDAHFYNLARKRGLDKNRVEVPLAVWWTRRKIEGLKIHV